MLAKARPSLFKNSSPIVSSLPEFNEFGVVKNGQSQKEK
jgi:hypothetical protein